MPGVREDRIFVSGRWGGVMKKFLLTIVVYLGWGLASWFLIFYCDLSYEKLQVYSWVVSLALTYICANLIANWVFKKGENNA